MKKITIVSILLICNSFLFATDFTWNNSAGGSFGTSTNWDPEGVPADGDVLHFTLAEPYTLTMDNYYLNDAFYVDGSNVTLDLNGYNYYLDLEYTTGPAAIIGDTTSSSLTVFGSFINSRDVVIGNQTGSVGDLTLTGTGTIWSTSYDSEWHSVWIGENGNAYLQILDNSQFLFGSGFSGVDSASHAAIDVDGTDSELYVDGYFCMSNWGSTYVNITNGGLVEMGRMEMALQNGSSAYINIDGTSHESELLLHANQENSLTLAKSGVAQITVRGSKVWNQGSMTIAEDIGSTGLLDIHEGSWVDCPNSVIVGGTFERSGGNGQINIIDDIPEDINGVNFTPTDEEGEFVKVWPNGTINMDHGVIEAEYGSDLANPIILEGGTLQGNGMIWANVINNGGIVAPSDTRLNKLIDIGYNYTQNSTGTLKIKIGGIEPIADYSHLRVTNPGTNRGHVSLNGFLDVELVNGFVPNYYHTFIIIAAQSLTGTFSNAASKLIFRDGSFDIIYDPTSLNSVVLTHYSTEPTCPQFPPADYNKDCKVNFADFATFAEEWLQCNLVPASSCE
jgi:T5SS/PEP-CTERM-associated repeat protein